MFDDPVFYDGLGGILRTVVAAGILYIAVVCAVRIFGKRSTSQMNNFDWIVSVAIGSLMASGVLLSNVTVLESVIAIYVLLSLQWGLTKCTFLSDAITKAVKSEPTLLLHNGEVLEDAMRRERLTKAELHAAIRGAGLSRIEDVQWIILETNATLSVIPTSQPFETATVLERVAGIDEVMNRS